MYNAKRPHGQQQRQTSDDATAHQFAEYLRGQGNAEFKAGNYVQATENYTRAIGAYTIAARQLLLVI
jgi:hypothetical protein